MSDDFDIRLERKLERKADGRGSDVTDVRRIELITGTGRRRRWSSEDKASIVVDSLKPGVSVSEVARRNGLSPQQLFGWRREARVLFHEGVSAAAADRSAANPAPPTPSQPPSIGSGTIEIAIDDAVVRVSGQVETSVLVAVLHAIRRAS